MKFLKYLLMITFVAILNIQAIAHNIDDIRKTFQKAIESPAVTEKLSSELNKIKNPDPILIAYNASVEALKAKHSWSPIAKYQYMELYQKKMDEAVIKSPNNLEIRFLRYNIQYNVPSYLGYSENLNEDRKFIIDAFIHKRFDTKNKNLILDVYKFMLHSKSINAREKQLMENVLRTL